MSIQRTTIKRRPSHPGMFIKEFILDELSITQNQLADALGLPIETINHIVDEKTKISLDIAMRFSRFTNTTPELWLNMQRSVDLWDARSSLDESIVSIKPHKFYQQAM